MEFSKKASPSKEPAMFEHKATGQAVVKLDGRFVYLGWFGSEEATNEYRRVVEWRAQGRRRSSGR
ncbi:MAG: hypothetical protein KDC98_00530 [Planctomycetes bacterium]|nr:hypothetical protein [Planctomycetota bacterium]